MPEISKRNFLSSMKEWISRYRITVVNVSVTVILVGFVIFFMLYRASSLQRQTAEESIVNLAGMTANEVQSVYLTYYDILRTTSQIMRNYQNIEINQRRAFVKSLMREIIYSNTSLINIYSLWKPDALDGKDSEYINTLDSDETGQFISGYTREKGYIEQRAFKDYRYILNLGYDDLGREFGVIREPFPMTGIYQNSWGVDIQVAIVSDTDVVGVIGATINLEVLQYLIEQKKPFGTGRTMVVTPKGTLVAHTNPDLRGASFMSKGARLEEREPLFSVDTALYVFNQIQNSMDNIEPVVFRVSNTLVVSYPLISTDPITAAYHVYKQPTDSGVPHWAVVTAVPMPAILAPVNAMLRYSILFIIGAGILTAFIVLLTYRGLSRQTQVLQHDLERATTMQDNLKYGLFLMDQQFVIQGVYSRALEKIMAVSNLQGKVFTDLLSSSLKGQEREGLADYLEMIFKRSFEKEMLDDINPIGTFTYISTETGETKSLRTSFTLAERGRGAAFILVTLEDISAEKRLEKQLVDAENQKEKEMRSLFQVIQLNPRVLSDFIEDTEYEFDKINEMLKNKTHFHHEVLMEMYQSIHAVKSNALILNLENFSNRLHKLETSIKGLQEKYEDFVPFDDFLGLVLELEEAMKEKDELKVAISKIQNFKTLSGEDNNQEQYVLIETLTQTCKKTQEALNKKARLVVEGIDDVVMEYGPRRAIKEVLTQLVRNGVYHGIETPEIREQSGKNTEGEIKLSIKFRDDHIIIKLTDDGKGIDFDQIRQTAESFNLLSTPAEANDKNNLLQVLFSPGFSTVETADVHAGRGMGLSLVKDRVRELKGNIKVSTVKGKGTTFTIVIPLEVPVAAKVS